MARAAWRNIFAVYEAALRLLHPFMPFITEELWSRLPQVAGARSISLARFPAPPDAWTDSGADEDMRTLQEIIATARNVRSELKLDPRRAVAAEFFSGNPVLRKLVEENLAAVMQLTPLSSLKIDAARLDSSAASSGGVRSTAEYDLRIPFEEAVDPKAEMARARKEIERLEKSIASTDRQLGDPIFRSKAPVHIVEGLQAKMGQQQVELKKLGERMRQLEASSGKA